MKPSLFLRKLNAVYMLTCMRVGLVQEPLPLKALSIVTNRITRKAGNILAQSVRYHFEDGIYYPATFVYMVRKAQSKALVLGNDQEPHANIAVLRV